MEIALVFPHQLFEKTPVLNSDLERVILIEDHLFFKQYPFHKMKLVLHRASMKYYEQFLIENGYNTQYIEAGHTGLDELFNALRKEETTKIHVVDPVDYLLDRRLKRFSQKHGVSITFYESPLFITSQNELRQRLKKTAHGYRMGTFYKEQRKAFDILMHGKEPVGGKWSFDEDNRKKLPKNLRLPAIYQILEDEFVREAKRYVNDHFPSNYGSLESFIYPVNFEQAQESLNHFLDNRMTLFGDYEDAIVKEESFLFHSLLTPALNIGLITPKQVVEIASKRHQKDDFPINSFEGFIRQIIGWREFMRGIYTIEGVCQRTTNHFSCHRALPHSFWTGDTGIEPIDDTIKKVLKYGYCHHIERLMLLGNFMLLCEFDPNHVYRWFMELFIDAYDWVMVPNVYGMSLYADGGLLSTKPYISSSNYVLKMSNYKKGEWCEVWDALYWRFIFMHREEFAGNQRMSMMINLLNKMDQTKLETHIRKAEMFLEQIGE
ncbi:cryptochrome/photolyase family protein [Fulvivirga sp. M361]|uniref:cryptochrome/photolyase family protein n=1 Tax=Fulvivirga sp. M361 TaxID=2594266 RepID=UPI001179CD41|nr:cryptochrome/photolyase family protein [Fulvivirga sp. M361]TRX61344.1 cryptochrome/photolyase family protein [Fulvivirga sp. M361]